MAGKSRSLAIRGIIINQKAVHSMSRIESKIGVVPHPAEKIYRYISNFDNFRELIPPDRVSDFESTGDTCRFRVEGIGQAGLKIVEKEPPKLIKISSDEHTSFDFLLWIQIKEVSEGDSRLKITTEVHLNPMMAAMAKKPLKNFVDTLVEQAEKLSFEPPPSSTRDVQSP
jgi:carbon monoxide dehydrogenase subunit G